MNLYSICAVAFYILLFSYLSIKIINVILMNKNNCKEQYRFIYKENKKNNIPNKLYKFVLGEVIFLLLYVGLAFLLLIISLFLGLITLGGAAYIDTGTDSSFYYLFMNFVKSYLSFFKYIPILFYIIIFIVLIRLIYIHVLNYKEIKKHSNERGDF